MHWTLCDVALRCAKRRSLTPGLAVLGVLPIGAHFAGDAAAPVFGAATADEGLANAVAFAIGTASASVGVVVAALVPTREFLGTQLAAAPIPRREAFVGLTLLPSALAAVPLLACVGLFAANAANGAYAVAIVLAAIAAAAFGAAAFELALGLARVSVAAVPNVAALAAIWLGAGLVAGDGALGPLAAPTAPEIGALVAAAGATAAAVAIWAGAAAGRPSARARTRRSRGRIPFGRSPCAALVAAMLARLARNDQVRRHIAVGVTFAVAGAATIRVVVGGTALGAYFAATAALLAAAVLPLIAATFARDAQWLFGAAPLLARSAPLAAAVGGVVGGFVVVASALVMSAPFARLDGGGVLMFEATVALVLASSVVAAMLVPWRRHRVVDQLSSYAALGGIALALSFAIGSTADAMGISSAVWVAIGSHVCLAAAVGLAR